LHNHHQQISITEVAKAGNSGKNHGGKKDFIINSTTSKKASTFPSKKTQDSQTP